MIEIIGFESALGYQKVLRLKKGFELKKIKGFKNWDLNNFRGKNFGFKERFGDEKCSGV